MFLLVDKDFLVTARRKMS